MHSIKNLVTLGSLLLLSFSLQSCIKDTKSPEAMEPATQEMVKSQPDTSVPKPTNASLPVQYQTPSYMVERKAGEDMVIAEEGKLKVGARITSTRGPQPLWDIVKRLAALKGMNVSWASDVDRNVLVDVDINANDGFYEALDNMLRQVDYFHEMQDNTIVIKYKETKQFQVAIPFIKQTYNTRTGGDVLGGVSTASGSGAANTSVAGEISLKADGVAINNLRDGKPGGIEFNIWNSIENNLNSILNVWSTDVVENTEISDSKKLSQTDNLKNRTIQNDRDSQTDGDRKEVSATFRRSTGGNSYFIDKPVGLITVTAPRPLIARLDVYFKSLKKELYKQVSIEAKIIEVQLDDNSSIGLNWNLILKNLSVASGALTGGKTYSRTKSNNTDSSNTTSNSHDVTNTLTSTSDRTSTSTGDRTYNFLDSSNPATDTGTSTSSLTDAIGSSNIVSDVASAAATSGVSAATILSQGVTGTLGGAVSLAAFTFDSFLNAVSQQGQTTILSNPKLSVMNGQPALLTVGRNVTYIKDIKADVSSSTTGNGVVTYTSETARALSGVGLALTANILDDEVILNLVPVTSELEEPIEYRTIGLGEVGLPIINLREMSSTVKVKNGEMLVIGGLISSTASNDGTFLPGTSNLSFFKYLFGYEKKTSQKRELIILLKPRII